MPDQFSVGEYLSVLEAQLMSLDDVAPSQLIGSVVGFLRPQLEHEQNDAKRLLFKMYLNMVRTRIQANFMIEILINEFTLPGMNIFQHCELFFQTFYVVLADENHKLTSENITAHMWRVSKVLLENCKSDDDALKILTSIPVLTINDSGAFRCWIYTKCVELYLRKKDIVGADQYLNRAAIAANEANTTQSHIKEGQGLVFKYKHKFLEASQRFNELSQDHTLSPEEQTRFVSEGLSCALIGAAGKQRARLLALFYKDKRCLKLPLFPILKEAFLDRILKLEDRQLCKKLIDCDASVVDRALSEHNIISVSKLYKNIQLEELSYRIGCEPRQTESIAAQMISEGRMEGTINQIDGTIVFDTRDNLQTFDKHIETLLQSTNSVIELIQSYYPDWTDAYKQKNKERL